MFPGQWQNKHSQPRAAQQRIIAKQNYKNVRLAGEITGNPDDRPLQDNGQEIMCLLHGKSRIFRF
ncbi:MAG: hypothetical protein EA363_11325 [Balneolaceae bacterium]|nr:MAG: hypothetical protein EA363_11325 [Balneolaceae bacterium]